MTSLTAVVDLEYWPMSSLACISENRQEKEDESVDDDDQASEEDDDDDFDAKSDAALAIVAEGSRAYIMIFESRTEKDLWIQSIQATVVGFGAASEARLDEESCRVHEVMRTSIFSAALLGELDVLENLLSTRKHLVQEVDAFGRYPAYYAVIKGNNACLAMMLDAGADAHKADQSGRRLASYVPVCLLSFRTRKCTCFGDAGGQRCDT